MATINFNANNYDFSQEDRPAYEPLPEGYYNVIAIESEIRETKEIGRASCRERV